MRRYVNKKQQIVKNSLFNSVCQCFLWCPINVSVTYSKSPLFLYIFPDDSSILQLLNLISSDNDMTKKFLKKKKIAATLVIKQYLSMTKT